jgi:hypothetical protein
MSHDSCENVQSGSLVAPAETEGPADRNSGPELRLRSVLQCSGGTGLSRHAGALHGRRDVYGAPDMGRVPWKPKRRRSCSYYTRASGRAGEPCCKCESRKAKAHRFPQPVTANTSFLILKRVPVCLLTLSAWPCVGRGKFRHPHLRNHI